MATGNPITANQLADVFDFDHVTGVITWKVKRARCVSLGSIAGSLSKDGYIRITLYRRSYPAHHIAWAMTYGYWPLMLDHKNGNKSDNRIDNLRICDVSLNAQNQRKAHTSNLSSGVLGVHFYGRTKRWRATIWFDGKNKFLGYHATLEAAQDAYLAAKRLHHSGCTI